MSDFAKRELGQLSHLALQGLEVTIWKRSVETIRTAEACYDAEALTPERALQLMTALLEQRKLVSALKSQVEDGVRAGGRLVREEAVVEARVARERQATTHGRNRFMRSRVGLPPDDAAS